jgi:hypothetical protein
VIRRVDDALRLRADLRCDGDDGVAGDGHVPAKPRIAGAVDDAAAADQDIEHAISMA